MNVVHVVLYIHVGSVLFTLRGLLLLSMLLSMLGWMDAQGVLFQNGTNPNCMLTVNHILR